MWISKEGTVWRAGKITRGNWKVHARSPIDGRPHGYFKLCLNRSKGAKGCEKQVAHFLLEAFVGPCPEGCTPDHIDCDTANNKLENLRWATRSQQRQNQGGQCQDPRRKNNRPIQYRRVGDTEWNTGPGQNIVADQLGVGRAGVWAVLKGKQTSTKGYEFRLLLTERHQPVAVAADENTEEHVSKKARVE